jgi:acetylornithine deacetylase/succinyl-diaminopimelate desuccinylase-like protein
MGSRRFRSTIWLIAGLSAALVPAALVAQQSPLAPHQRLAHDVYKQIIEINTADSSGSVTKAIDVVAARFRAAGFPASDVHVLTPEGHPTKANLVVRYPGRGTKKPILLVAHMDVVAALRSDWSMDPFVLHEQDGNFYGRGTSDDKAMAAIFVANMLRDRAAGWVPDRDVILALTADEEAGPADGVEFLVDHHRDLIDAAFAINEGGGAAMRDGKVSSVSVQAAEKLSIHLNLTTTNRGGHSSVPRPDNAIYQLLHGLHRIEQYQFPVQLNEATRGYFAQTAPLEKPEIGAALRAIVANPNDTAAITFLSSFPHYNALLRTTCVPTELAAGHDESALPQTARAHVSCRVMPPRTAQDLLTTLRGVLADTGITITVTSDLTKKSHAVASELMPEVMDAVTAVTHAMYGPDVVVIPTMSTGGTDGVYLREGGIPTYGVSGMWGGGGAHGRDEHLPIKSFYDGQEFLYRLVHRLAGG